MADELKLFRITAIHQNPHDVQRVAIIHNTREEAMAAVRPGYGSNWELSCPDEGTTLRPGFVIGKMVVN